ncbi:hypothetical protein OH809_24845 [Streptomyces sp. NBC_00873]|uniref:hypothetical protein n=1 Tax=Streptomyces sp. NBC_00873 TaxID=2975852 RepID=UPI00386A0C16|nr:hypothetical protein OH809_24845 [Streptomyces sp. NBC_00873]
MQPAAPALDIHLDLPNLEAAARKWATRARALGNRAVCDDQENALSVAAISLDSAAYFLDRGETDAARDALRAACSYAGCEEAGAPQLAAAARTLLDNLPA